jgi:methylmalonyl-CoA mutase
MSPESKKIPSNFLEENADLLKDFSVPGIDEWKVRAEAGLKGAPPDEKLVTRTIEGIELKPLYCSEDVPDIPDLSNFPGFIPYLRGTRSNGYIKTPWDICQEISGVSPEEFNRELKTGLKMGQTAVNLILDPDVSTGMPPCESDSTQAGPGGVRLFCLSDLSAALSGVKLSAFPLYIKTGFSALPMLMMLEALADQRHEKMENLKGGIEADPLGFWVVKGNLPVSMERAFDDMAESTKRIYKQMAEIKTIGVDVSVYQDAGASATVELGFALATAVEYINQLQDRKLRIDDIARQIRFTFGIGPHYFMEIAKFRAGRMLWARIVQEYGGREVSRKMAAHARTSRHFNSFYDPYVNILRSTTGAFSAILGGVDSLHSGSFDESFSVPDEFSRRMARNIQLILLNESHVNQPVDPAGGSYYIETLTSQTAEKSWLIFQELMRSGGMLKSLEKGIPQSMIDRLNGQRASDFIRLKTVLIGVNVHAEANDDGSVSDPGQGPGFRKAVDPGDGKTRDNHHNCSVKMSASDPFREGVKAFLSGATLRDVSAALFEREEPGPEIAKIRMFRLAEVFEDLKNRLGLLSKKNGFRPTVFQFLCGPVAEHKIQADFSRGIFELPGFRVESHAAGAPFADILDLIRKTGASIVVICPGRNGMEEKTGEIIQKIRQIIPDAILFVVGDQSEHEKRFCRIGADAYIYQGVDVHMLLDRLITRLEEM